MGPYDAARYRTYVVVSWGIGTRTPNCSTRNCCVTNYTIPQGVPWAAGEQYSQPSAQGGTPFVAHQFVSWASRRNPMIRPTPMPAASRASLASGIGPPLGDVVASRPNSRAIARTRAQ